MGISPRLATGGGHVSKEGSGGSVGAIECSRAHTQELLQLHDGAACSQPVVDRVSVRVVLAMLLVEVILVDGARGVLVHCKRRHAG
jgi:hypothetical protein